MQLHHTHLFANCTKPRWWSRIRHLRGLVSMLPTQHTSCHTPHDVYYKRPAPAADETLHLGLLFRGWLSWMRQNVLQCALNKPNISGIWTCKSNIIYGHSFFYHFLMNSSKNSLSSWNILILQDTSASRVHLQSVQKEPLSLHFGLRACGISLSSSAPLALAKQPWNPREHHRDSIPKYIKIPLKTNSQSSTACI